APSQSRRDRASKPRVARNELPWVTRAGELQLRRSCAEAGETVLKKAFDYAMKPDHILGKGLSCGGFGIFGHFRQQYDAKIVQRLLVVAFEEFTKPKLSFGFGKQGNLVYKAFVLFHGVLNLRQRHSSERRPSLAGQGLPNTSGQHE